MSVNSRLSKHCLLIGPAAGLTECDWPLGCPGRRCRLEPLLNLTAALMLLLSPFLIVCMYKIDKNNRPLVKKTRLAAAEHILPESTEYSADMKEFGSRVWRWYPRRLSAGREGIVNSANILSHAAAAAGVNKDINSWWVGGYWLTMPEYWRHAKHPTLLSSYSYQHNANHHIRNVTSGILTTLFVLSPFLVCLQLIHIVKLKNKWNSEIFCRKDHN